MNKKIQKIIIIMLVLSLLTLIFAGCRKDNDPRTSAESTSAAVSVSSPAKTEADTDVHVTVDTDVYVTIDGTYTSKEEVAAYINEFKCLPSNYITKSEAKSLGWDSSKGNLWDVAEGKSIGGDRFGNYEGYLPKAKDRVYYECDIGYGGGRRGPERIVFSNDGLIYYTEDHYNTFELLYGED